MRKRGYPLIKEAMLNFECTVQSLPLNIQRKPMKVEILEAEIFQSLAQVSWNRLRLTARAMRVCSSNQVGR